MPQGESMPPGQPAAQAAMPAPVADQNAAPMDHSHMPIALPEGVPTPRLALRLQPDVMSGYNVELQLENYRLRLPPPPPRTMAQRMAPSLADGLAAGHAHLYINGEKKQRVYGRLLHVPAEWLRPGVNQISVSLNSDGHMVWTAQERKILATLFINPQAEPGLLHHFASFPP